MAVDLKLTPGFGPGPQAATPFGQTMRCPASVFLPPSSCPPITPKDPTGWKPWLEYPSGFLVNFWPFDGFLSRGEEGFESAAGQERKQAQSCMKEEIAKIPRPDMSQAGKAYVYIDFNHGWVGGRKQLITGYDKSETELTICKLGRLLSAILK